jgi:hypothetical protein
MANQRRRSNRKTVKKRTIRMHKAGGRVTKAAAASSELIALRRNDRMLRAEMDDHMRAIGKRVWSLQKRARGESPFSRFKSIMRQLDTPVLLEDEYRATRSRLARLREQLQKSGP